MSRKTVAFFIILIISMLVIPSALATPVPLVQSDWYAVAWLPSTDSLHFINATSQQATIPRPTWTDEDPNVAPQIHITPNGRTLIQVVTTQQGRQQIGFHDLETGQLLASHEAQIGESFVWSDDNPSWLQSPRFAIGMTAPDVSQWRIIVFDTMTGSPIAQLANSNAVPLPGNTFFPHVVHYDLNEGQAQLSVHFQMRNADGEAYAFEWLTDSDTVMMGPLSFSEEDGYDIDNLTDAPTFVENGNVVRAIINGQMTQIIAETGTVNDPTWLNETQWLGYRYSDGVFAPHWRVGVAQANMDVIPLGPNIAEIYGTPDGFLAQDDQANTLMHTTVLPAQAHEAEVGNIIFNPNVAFEVIYVTPWGANFDLDSVFYDNGNGIVDNELELAPPVAQCDNSPASRLDVGMRARVTFTDGTALRLRNAPNGDIISQLAEGTQFDIIDGFVCDGGYTWWQIQTDNNLVGWSAEGVDDSYFMEEVLVADLVVPVVPATAQPNQPGNVAPQPTAEPNQPLDVAPQPTAQPTQQLGFAPQATATLGIVLQANPVCPSSPPSQLSVGMIAITNTTGTLAMRVNISDPTPTWQVPNNVSVMIIEGPRCSENGQRMWRVRTNLNAQQVEGWLAEGWQNSYFLLP